jgi:SAM-dependent methyltransferase
MAEGKTPLRATFDEDAVLYDEVRPGYPEALYDDIIALSAIPPSGRILEIGCGTGQATVPFARRDYRILAVELGANLAAVARHNLAPYPRAQVWTGAFEAWPLEEGAFDLAISATAFHWVDPGIGYPRLARALKPGGAFAPFWNLHVRGDADRGFYEAVQEVYRREAPALVEPWNEVSERAGEIARTGLFGEVAERRYRWAATYDAAGYIRLLNTTSDHRSLDPATRDRLFRGITQLIDTAFDGQIAKCYLTVLYVARRT